MANKLPYPVSERRLRPIYDYLDNGNNKKALQEADKALKKQPTLLCAKVLKGLALLRLGNETECQEQLESVRKESPVDEPTLQAMTACYREMDQPHMICQLYKSASQKNPTNEELLSNLFLSYVRVSDFTKQQQTALAINKVKPKNQYCMWAVMSCLLQAAPIKDLLLYLTPPLSEYNPDFILNSTKDKYKITLPLKLASKMLEKLIKEDKVKGEKEAVIYLAILEMENNYENALEMLEGPFGELLSPELTEKKKIDLLMKLGRWDQALAKLKAYLVKDIDSWIIYTYYLDVLFRVVEQDKSKATALFGEAKDLFSNLLGKAVNEDGRSIYRSPYLAPLAFYAMLLSKGYQAYEISGDIVQQMLLYVYQFGTLECCLQDLRPYLKCLTQDEVLEFLTCVWDYVGLEIRELPRERKQMLLHITNLELTRATGFHEKLEVEDKEALVCSLLRLFLNSQQFCEGMQETEPRPGDRYILLAIHIIYDIWVATGDPNTLFEAIVLCQYALTFSPSNSQFKLLQLKFFHVFGASNAANDAYLLLEIKHMQMDSLGYLHTQPLMLSGHYSCAFATLSNTTKFFDANCKDSADHITLAYKFDSLAKVPEFIDLRERLVHSLHHRVCLVERTLHELFHCSSYKNTLQLISELDIKWCMEEVEWTKLRDNRDFKVIWEFDPEHKRITQTEIECTRNHDMAFLRVRSLILKILVTALTVIQEQWGGTNSNLSGEGGDTGYESSSSNGSTNHMTIEQLIELTKELEQCTANLKKNRPTPIPQIMLGAPPTCRLLVLAQYNYLDVILDHIWFLIRLLPGEQGDQQQALSHLDSIVLYFEVFFQAVPSMFNTQSPIGKRNILQMSTTFLEILSFSCLINGAIDQIISVLRKGHVKKQKKKKDNPKPNEKELKTENQGIDWRMEFQFKFNSYISDANMKFESLLKDEQNYWDTKRNGILSLIPSTIASLDKSEASRLFPFCKIIEEKLYTSYNCCVDQILNHLRCKLKFISQKH